MNRRAKTKSSDPAQHYVATAPKRNPLLSHFQPHGTGLGPALAAPAQQHLASQPALLQPASSTRCLFTPRGCPFGGACQTCPLPAQAKLTINQPGDRYEQEADHVADQVMRMPDPLTQRQATPGEEEEAETVQTKPLAAQITPLVQRACATCPDEDTSAVQRAAQPEEEEEIESLRTKPQVQRQAMPEKGEETVQTQVQRQTLPEEDEETVQTRPATARAPHATPGLEARIQGMRGGGSPLPAAARAFFEPRFGADFSGVRVHSDARAAETARAVRAQAFTLGRDVVFGAGQYAPGTDAGRRLLRHELTHVVQQGGTDLIVQRQKSVANEAETPEARLRRQATTIITVLSRAVANADEQGYSGITLTIRHTGDELWPGFAVQKPHQPRPSGMIPRMTTTVAVDLRPILDMILISGAGQWRISYVRDNITTRSWRFTAVGCGAQWSQVRQAACLQSHPREHTCATSRCNNSNESVLSA